jgi:hypothetical protein
MPEKPIPNKYLKGYPPIKINVIIIKKIIAAVEKFDGKIKKTTRIIGIHNGNIVLEKFMFLL